MKKGSNKSDEVPSAGSSERKPKGIPKLYLHETAMSAPVAPPQWSVQEKTITQLSPASSVQYSPCLDVDV